MSSWGGASSVTFPNFKVLELSDQRVLSEFTARFPKYSDFEFASLWSWNPHESALWSTFQNYLILRFSDYSDSQFFYSFLGDGPEASELALHLLSLSTREGLGSSLRLVPEVAARCLDPVRFAVEQSPDDADYLYDLRSHLSLAGKRFRKLRQGTHKFAEAHSTAQTVLLDFDHYETRRAVNDLWLTWASARGTDVPNETRAFERFLSAHRRFDTCAVGIVVAQTLIAMDITVLLPDGVSSSLFQKSELRYAGVNAHLAREVAQVLVARGCTTYNAQQDLGLEALRRSKLNHVPSGYLRKYRVSLRSG